jgi:hypothetical protein
MWSPSIVGLCTSALGRELPRRHPTGAAEMGGLQTWHRVDLRDGPKRVPTLAGGSDFCGRFLQLFDGLTGSRPKSFAAIVEIREDRAAHARPPELLVLGESGKLASQPGKLASPPEKLRRVYCTT